MAKKGELDFDRIDRRGSHCIVDTFYLNRNNIMVCHKAEREYLHKLKELQEEIKAKYQPQLTEGDDFSYHSDEYFKAHEEFEMPLEESVQFWDLWDS